MFSNKTKAALALALCVGLGASWTPTSSTAAVATIHTAAAPQVSFSVDAPVAVVDGVGGIVFRVDPPELSAVFPVLP